MNHLAWRAVFVWYYDGVVRTGSCCCPEGSARLTVLLHPLKGTAAQLGAVLHVQLGLDLLAVCFNRPRTQSESSGNLLDVEPFTNHFEDFQFPVRKTPNRVLVERFTKSGAVQQARNRSILVVPAISTTVVWVERRFASAWVKWHERAADESESDEYREN